MYVDLSKLPSAPTKYQVALGALYGGLNTSKIPSEIGSSQCSELVNVMWRNGVLRSRQGQEAMPNLNEDGWTLSDMGNAVPRAICDTVWHDRLFMAFTYDENEVGRIVAYDLRTNRYETIFELTKNKDQLVDWHIASGSFFRFGEKLYYKQRNAYVEITYESESDYVTAQKVTPYIPVIQINTNADGVGDLYQPENRLSEWKEVWYDLDTGLAYEELVCDGKTTVFYLSKKRPEQPQHGDLRDVVQVYIGAKLGVRGEDYEVNLNSGAITVLGDAPAIGVKLSVTMLLYSFAYLLPVDSIDRLDGTPQINVWVKNLETGEYDQYRYSSQLQSSTDFGYSSGIIVFDSTENLGGAEAYKFDANVRSRFIKVQYAKANPDAKKAIDDCQIAVTYGSTGIEANCVVMSGSEAQPNAIFWSGNDENGANPAYFPIEQYNLVGEHDDPITAFGRQQNKLVIFQKRRTSSATYDFTTVDDRLTVSLNVMTINDKIGCDIPNSVQLVENNLVWANSRQGVMYLKDSTYAYETLVVCISGNINEDSKATQQSGLISALRAAKIVSSLDDGERYWIIADGNAFIWDYSLQGYTANTEKLCWFFAKGINACGWAQDHEKIYALSHKNLSEEKDIWLFQLTDSLSDFDRPFEKVIRLQTQVFGTFSSMKNVDIVIFTCDSTGRTRAQIEYITDYMIYKDRTDIDSLHETENAAAMNPICVRVRKPKCIHIQQFAIRLSNNEAYDLNLISAQIFYTSCSGALKAGQRM